MTNEELRQRILALSLHQGHASGLRKLIELLESNAELSMELRSGLALVLKDNSDSDYQLVFKRRASKRGRPSKTLTQQTREASMGVNAVERVMDGEKYEVVIREVADRFKVGVPTVEKAYSRMKREMSEDE